MKSIPELESYFASASNPPKGYGLELGLKIGKFRGDRTEELRKQGMGLEQARRQAQKEITEKWGLGS